MVNKMRQATAVTPILIAVIMTLSSCSKSSFGGKSGQKPNEKKPATGIKPVNPTTAFKAQNSEIIDEDEYTPLPSNIAGAYLTANVVSKSSSETVLAYSVLDKNNDDKKIDLQKEYGPSEIVWRQRGTIAKGIQISNQVENSTNEKSPNGYLKLKGEDQRARQRALSLIYLEIAGLEEKQGQRTTLSSIQDAIDLSEEKAAAKIKSTDNQENTPDINDATNNTPGTTGAESEPDPTTRDSQLAPKNNRENKDNSENNQNDENIVGPLPATTGGIKFKDTNKPERRYLVYTENSSDHEIDTMVSLLPDQTTTTANLVTDKTTKKGIRGQIKAEFLLWFNQDGKSCFLKWGDENEMGGSNVNCN